MSAKSKTTGKRATAPSRDVITAHHQAFLNVFGREIKNFRTDACITQAKVSSVMNWNRDALSKIETGKNNISVYDYLRIINYLRDSIPADHPALALSDRWNNS